MIVEFQNLTDFTFRDERFSCIYQHLPFSFGDLSYAIVSKESLIDALENMFDENDKEYKYCKAVIKQVQQSKFNYFNLE